MQEHITTVLTTITGIVTGNPLIWIPVLAAWALGFLYTRFLNSTNLQRRRDREFRVYSVNGVFAFLLYCAFNFTSGWMVFLPQATLASAVAILAPAVWFWWQNRKSK